MSRKPSKDPDVFNEPHLRARLAKSESFTPGSDGVDDEPALAGQVQPPAEIEHSVWDERGLTATASADAMTWRNHLAARNQSTSAVESWIVTLGTMLLTGPVAALASLLFFISSGQRGLTSVTLMCIVSPLIQEMFKIMIPLWIAEKRPWLFKSWFQFFLIALTTGTVFAVVNNVLVLWFLPDSTGTFVFKWIVVLGLHLVTTTISMTGVERIWRQTNADGKPPRLEVGYGFFITAIGIHMVFAIGYTVALVFYEINAWL